MTVATRVDAYGLRNEPEMSSVKVQGPLSAVHGLPLKLPEGFKNKMIAQWKSKFMREEEVMARTLTPSAFLKEMSLTTEQKLALPYEMHPPRIIQLLDISETSFQKFSTVDVDQTLFQPFPSEIVFQNYVPHETYEVPLVLRNEDRIPRLVKVIQEISPYFKIISPTDPSTKVACGMQSTFRILFTPDENKDYFHEVICVTEREKFVVPIRAIGARAILDFPDQLNFSTCPVKYNSQKTLLVRNIGNREAKFCLNTWRPFSAEPSVGTLGIGDSMQMTVEFKPQFIGDHCEDLIINYDTGDIIYVRLYGAAIDINIRLDKNSLLLEKTFITMANQRMVTIINRSDIIAHFQWKAFSTQEEEDQEKFRLYSDLHFEEEDETDRFLEECGSDPSIRERLSILSRTFYNRRKMIQTDSMLFSNDIFMIEPVEGDIWPNSTFDVNVVFKPQQAQMYQSTIYCDITGRETRLPLRMKGEGIGPRLLLNFDQLDIGKIFVNSAHGYEAVLSNKGYIDAIFTLIPPSTALGSGFLFNPSEGIILPDGHQVIEITFSTSKLGDFTEVFMFNVDGSPEPVNLTIKGCVIGPTFHFSTPALHFGDISFGFPYTLNCSLNNTSLVPLTFNLRIPGDGPGDLSTTCSSLILDNRNTVWEKGGQRGIKPTEFSIFPSHGIIRSQGFLNIQVTLCSNTVKKYELAMMVDVTNVGEEVLALPITARCLVPLVHVENPILKFGRCFLQYPYEQSVKLVNKSNLPACYCVLSQEFENQPQVLYSSPSPRGLIDPHSSVSVPLVLETQITGIFETKVYMCIFGSKERTLEVNLLSTGVGPVVCVKPIEFDFGKIQVLTEVSKTLQLSNQSCIPAHFLAQMIRSHSYWSIEPSEGVILPETDVMLTLVAKLDDTVKFSDKVQLAIENSNTYTIPVQAKGIGNTISTDRPFVSGLNLGVHFGGTLVTYHFTMTNHGRRTYQLYWMTEGFPQFTKSSHSFFPTGVKAKNSLCSLEPHSPVFKFSPFRMELNPGQSMDVVVEGSSETAKVVKEILICHAIIGRSSVKEVIMKVDVSCEFIAPILYLSAKELKFTAKKLSDDVMPLLYQPLTLKNISALPVSILMSVDEPFSICDKDQNTLPASVQATKLLVDEQTELFIRFNPNFLTDINCRLIEDMLTIHYLEHPQKEFVTLYAEVHFPNLDFDSTKVDFGCIVNDTEVIQYIQMTNNSPLPVKYHWSFLMSDWNNQISYGLKRRQERDIINEESKFFRELQLLNFSKNELNLEMDLNPEFHSTTWTTEENYAITGVEEVFDILPLYGIVQPKECQQVAFTFFGHADISIQAKALCTLEGGPTYEIMLYGEASLVSYALSTKEVDCGLQLFDEVLEIEIVLRNTGKVGFDYIIPDTNEDFSGSLFPGVPLILPVSGHIDSDGELILKIYYLPGIPEAFFCTFQIQVGHLEPEDIIVKGEGIFPRIFLDLPRNIKKNKKYQKFLDEAKQNLEKENKMEESLSRPMTNAGEANVDDFFTNFDTLLQMEAERLMIKEYALKQQAVISNFSSNILSNQWTRKKLVKISMPDYLLDFGYIILGEVRTHIIKITNTSHLPVSFYIDRKALANTGFSMELDRVKNLPYCETETFEVKFDPQSANLPLGNVKILVPIQVVGGPIFPICLCASVTMPTLTMSCDKLDFSYVQCGQCKMKSLQLHNELHVACEWTSGPPEAIKNIKSANNINPLQRSRKRRRNIKPKPQVFEMVPHTGVLLPGQKVNVQVKFMPLEEKYYNQRLVMHISQSSQRMTLLVQGQGLEPRLDFSPHILELGPILPYSSGEERELLVKNPCSFPIEFYCVELDKQYLEEEEILKMVKGYDSFNTLLLPARFPGEKLPQELLEFYEEQKKVLEQLAREREAKIQENGLKGEEEQSEQTEKPITTEGSIQPITTEDDISPPKGEIKTEEGQSEAVKASSQVEIIQSRDEIDVNEAGELDDNPVSRAIARYLGIDITPEGRAAMNRKGIAIVVHGSPLSGKTTMAVALAKFYGVACLSIDSVVLEAISSGNTPAGFEARKLCMKAALEKSQRDIEESGFAIEGTAGQLIHAPGGLSMEAVAKHTAEGTLITETKTAPQSSISKGNKTSTGGGKIHAVQGSRQHHHQIEQITSSSFLGGPVPCRISVSASVAGESGLMSCVLPTELLVEILAERMQLSDCYQGVVFDGLETLFAQNFPSALVCLLKAINNRNHIYFVSLNQEYETLKDHERALREAEEVEQESARAKEKARIEEMDEDEYEALSVDERARVDEQRLKTMRERRKREQERLAQEKIQKELLRRRQEEDEARKKGKRVKKDSAKDEVTGKKSQPMGKQITSGLKSDTRQDSAIEKKIGIKDRPDSSLTEAEEANKKKKLASLGYDELDRESLDESEKQLFQKFKNYEYGKKEMIHILTFWDRVQGIVNQPSAVDESQHDDEQALERQAPSGKKVSRKDREKERLEKEKAEKERLEKEKAEKERQDKLKAIEETRALSFQTYGIKLEGDLAESLDGDELDKNVKLGVPHLEFLVYGRDDPSSKIVLESGKLPSLDEVLDGLGLGPSGPPMSPDTLLSVVPYPAMRKHLNAEDVLENFIFITQPSPEDLSMTAEEKKEPEPEMDHIIAPLVKEEPITPTKSRGKKDKQDSGLDRSKEKRRSASVKKSITSQDNSSTPPRAQTPVPGIDRSSSKETVQDKFLRLSSYRWIVPPNENVSIWIHFSSLIGGQFDQTLNFEIMGTQRLYQVYCRGICSLPSISLDPKILFSHRKKEAKLDEIIQKKYVLQTKMFYFGPLLCGKSRERYKSGQYPENMEKITICNNSSVATELFFCFLHDVKATTFILEPPNMILSPNEKQELSIWAYPTTTGIIEESIVCCIKDNPEPVLIKICCHGVRPELELDRKQLHFDKILMHRKETKTLFLRNSTLLAVAWRITGMDNLGDDFALSQNQGIIGPRSEFSLQIHFRGTKVINVKRFIRLEVSDVQNILGIVQVENIQIVAEAYDIALDISFPKGAEGGLDFGIVKVLDEAKQIMSLKNKGKYEIGFSFFLDTSDSSMQDLNSIFSIIPQKGILAANERATQIQIIFRSKKEIFILEKPILRCQVIEPNICEGGETIASIPVKISVQSVCTKYKILPSSGINFGAMILGSRKICTFTIENQGKLEFKFSISKPVTEVANQNIKKSAPPTMKHMASREGSSSSKSVQPGKGKRGESQKDSNIFAQTRFLIGMFTVSPGSGSIPPGGQHSIMVECYADQLGKSEEILAIDIADRDQTDHPTGIPYGLITEVCIPGFVTENITAMFEEHRICKNIDLYESIQTLDSEGIYLEEENKFIFTNVLVGHSAKARFKIINEGKVPCDVALSVKSLSVKSSYRINDIFEMDPTRISIPSHSHGYATVTFSPMMMQSYSCIFEAVIDGAPSLILKARHLTFEIAGEGNLPQVSILRPVVRNKHGNPLLLFKRLLVGYSETLPLILKNEGTVPAQLHIDLLDDQESFFLKPRSTTHCIYPVNGEQTDKMAFGTVRRAHTASLNLNVGESAEFDVLFIPCLPQHFEATIRLSVLDNQYEENMVHLVGEGYQDDLTLDHIHYLMAASGIQNVEGQLKDTDIEDTRMDHIQFGDCNVGKPYEVTFTMTNHNREDVMRFEWPAEAPLRFHPQVGHLHARCSKDITLTLKSEVPVNLHKNIVKCNVSRITFTLPVDLVPDWDDRLHTVKWVDCVKSPTSQRPTKRKVVETDPEPAHNVLEGHNRELEILISANVDYAQFMCKMENVHFKDTLLFQSRIYEYQLTNIASVQLEFSWQVTMVDNNKTAGGPQECIQSNLEGETPLASAQIAKVEGRSSKTSQLGNVLESVSSCLSVGVDVLPFSIEPSRGIILPKKQQDFLIKFFPQEVGEFEGKLFCSIPNLLGDQLYPELKLKGKSLLPYCHFELEDSDYITKNRRNPELRGPQGTPPGTTLDPNTRVIEFSIIGVHTKSTRSFTIMNPTNSAYSFKWTCEDILSLQSVPAFHCLTKSGWIRSEKKAEITFEFISQELNIVESFWTFTIPEQNISVPFLLVGKTTEPLVTLDRSHFNFLSLLVGREAQAVVYLVNNEEQAFTFSFRENSRFSEGFLCSLVVKPMEGDILPRSRNPITIVFTPTIEGEVNFNLICDVKSKTQPLTLNVKADGYIMDAFITCKDKHGAIITLNAQKNNEISFKKVDVNDMAMWQLNIVNNGNVGFTFDCKITAPKHLQQHLTIVPEKGLIEGGQGMQTMLTFYPLQKCILKDARLKIKISNGPVFSCVLLGSAVIPRIRFSFLMHDFGSCFIYHAGMPSHKRTLVITNKENKEISLDCLFVNTAYLEIEFQAEVLIPGGKMEVPITFYPREAIQYHENLCFEINEHSQQIVEIFGRGAEMKIEVLNPQHKVVNFGVLQVGQSVKKIVPIVNKSDASLTFSLGITPTMQALQDPKVFTLSPSMEITLKPQDIWKVELTISPKSRIPPFTEEVMMEHAGLSRCLFVFRGCSHGIEINLDQNNIPFGAAVSQSHIVRRIVMFNTGDIGARFNWDIKKFQPDFSITPVEGYIIPGMEVGFQVTFHPQSLNQNILYENLKCFIEGSKPLTLTLSGSGVGIPSVKEVMNFQCVVRGRQTQTIMLSNRTNSSWNLRPIIEGEHWTGSDSIIVDAQQNKSYEITYQPLTMTTENKHQGSIFFPLPDGTGLVYLLQGVSESPKTSGNIIREVPCKTSYNELLTVTNWLNRAQRFHVLIDFLKQEKQEPITIIKGLDYHEVPASSKRDYKLTFFSHKEGTFNVKVTFRNDTTQEYMFYFVTFKATPPGIISTIEIVTPVRQSTSAVVKIENPLSIPVTFNVECKVPEINFPTHFIVPALSEGNLVFEYQPLKISETTGRLTLVNSELGIFQYELILKAIPAKPEKPIYFCTALGSSQVLSVKFMNYARQKAEYSCKIDSIEFHVEKVIHAAPGSQGGTEISVEVTYEPSQLGQTQATLFISSPTGGDYTFPLVGSSVPPKPQGPIQIRTGSSTTITFKNIFPQTMLFSFNVDNPLFSIKGNENIRSKKVNHITVNFEGNPSGSKAPITGKLTISCPRTAGTGQGIYWIYYLKGVTPEK
uniref:Hydrocephalus-inducing protein homolog isoform X3 n=1 Tax=Geotrypetes seraphini TaxID=260995 RepID=A0A6P8QPX7_GEOSA|nr:hydrocephalus-inducing protein homolog isoform X3 [Geotrypetes seraphini]